jgi:hypothetical protein
MPTEDACRVVVVTAIGRPDSVRSRLHRRFVDGVRDAGYEMVAVFAPDCDTDTRKYFDSKGAHVYSQEGGTYGSAFRQAVREGHALGDAEVISYSEPEKVPYVKSIIQTARPVLCGNTSLVVPKRKSMESYPRAQRIAETECNAFFGRLTGRPLDVMFGPKTFSIAVVPHFLGYERKLHILNRDVHDAHLLPVMDVIREGLRVESIEVDYTHPAEQTAAEENDLHYDVMRYQRLVQHASDYEIYWRMLTS